MQFCRSDVRLFLLRSLAVTCIAAIMINSGQAADIRDRAVLSLSFDELPAGPVTSGAADTSKNGKVADAAALPAGGTAIASAFVPGSSGRSLLLDPAAKQMVVVSNGEDLSHGDAVTISGFFANLLPLTDNSFHGLFAKRQPDGPGKTNYGINYNPMADSFQLYVNDGTGYKVAVFSVKSSIGFRRRTHIIAAFDNADAPGTDADTDADDLRVRLFVNGAPATPTSVPGGFADGVNGWLPDVTLQKCVLDTPFTIGGSFVGGEAARIITDDIHLFAESLSDADAKALFQEVAGAAADEILKEQSAPATEDVTEPRIGRLSPIGLTIGKTNKLIVRGRNLSGAVLRIAGSGLSAQSGEGSNAQQSIFTVDVPADTAPGRYQLQVVTDHGGSNSEIVCLDSLPQFEDGAFKESTPTAELPVAVSGLIAGTEQKRVFFNGKAGQHIAAEVEAKRLGSLLDPVVEIKSAAGTPLAVQWQQSELSGDARALATLPADGLYYAEIHDLQFRAPPNSAWRLLLGDLPPTAIAFPQTLTSAAGSLRTVGSGGISEALSVNATSGRLVLESGASLLPLPPLRTTAGTLVTEPVEGTFEAKPIDATFTAAPFLPLFVSGRIMASSETDQILLTVTPGQILHFAIDAQTLASALRAELSVFNGDARIGYSDGDSGAADPSFDVTVPEGVTQLKVQIRDFTSRGSAASVYRLEVGRKDRPDLALVTNRDSIRLPANGSVPVRVSVIRQSASYKYTGAIRLQTVGMPGVTVSPAVIPASDQNQEVLLVVTRNTKAESTDNQHPHAVAIEAQTEGLEVNVSTRLKVVAPGVPLNVVTLSDDAVLTADTEAVSATVFLDGVPPVILRGVNTSIPIRVLPLRSQQRAFARFEMMTTETPRKEDPAKPDSPLKPMVAAAEFQFASAGDDMFPLQISVPLDVAEPVIDAVIGVDFVDQPLASDTGPKAWTAPIRLTVENAVELTPPAEPVKAQKGAMASISGILRRHTQFAEPVTVTVEGLPAGYKVTAATVAADAQSFAVEIAVPADAAAGEVPNVTLRGLRSAGQPLTGPVAVKLVIE